MIPSAYDLKEFYANRTGRIVRRLLRAQMLSLWPDAKGMRMLVCGYGPPHVRPYQQEAERVILQMPPGMGAHPWPPEGRNIVTLSASAALPIETNSIDRLVVVHGLEFASDPAETFAEYWRVLKSTGRMIVIAPSRTGLWSRIDWTPFGYGMPFSSAQLYGFLREQGFVIEEKRRALYVPPWGRGVFLNAANFFEKIGPYLYPAFGGLHVIEVGKQVYALTGRGEKVRAARPARMIARPEPTTRNCI